jgi:hypothetical protein
LAILNYTTAVNVDRTVAEIQKILAAHGARSIQVDYENGQPAGLAFFIETSFGERAFVLPANIDGVFKTLTRPNARVPRRFATRQQAGRVAWRILKDWIAAQMAIVEAGLAPLEQIMLPYLQVNEGSLYDAVRQSRLALPAARAADQ